MIFTPIFIRIKLRKRPLTASENFYSIPMNKIGSVDTLLKSGGEAGVGMFVVQSVATVSRQVQSINDFIHAACQEHPDRLIGFGTIHPGHGKPSG